MESQASSNRNTGNRNANNSSSLSTTAQVTSDTLRANAQAQRRVDQEHARAMAANGVTIDGIWHPNPTKKK